MKRIGRLFEKISTWENLSRAAWAAAQGKRDRPEVCAFFADLETNLSRMGQQLLAGEYRFSPYRAFEVRDTKRRIIHAPAFADRVAHHAIIAVTRAGFEASALPHSYACRLGKGQHAALRQASAWTRAGQWYGKMDVRKFYDSVDHSVLLGLLRRRFRERRLLSLFSELLASYGTEPGKGLPIGALTSQYFGNFMLDRFDHDLKDTGLAHCWVRYMDDAVVWTAEKRDLALLREAAAQSLGRLGLELKHGGEWNRCDQGVPFLGFVLYPDRLRLGKNGRQRLLRKFAAVSKNWRAGRLTELEAQSRATALFAHACTGDDIGWRRAVLAFHDFGDGPGPRSRPTGRHMEQHARELPLRQPQQEQAWQPQQEQRLPPGFGPRIGESDSPDDARSRARPPAGRAETTEKSLPGADTRRGASRKASGGAPSPSHEDHD